MSLRDWTKKSGAFKIGELTTNDSVLRHLTTGTKYLECVTDGSVAIPSKQAYGTWEFDIYKKLPYTSTFVFLINNKTTFDYPYLGYDFLFNGSNAIYFRGNTGVFLRSKDNYISNNIWYRIKIIRTFDGTFTMYIKGGSFGDNWVLVSTTGGSGTNPVTNNTYTTSNYMVLDLDAGDKIANIKLYDGVRQ